VCEESTVTNPVNCCSKKDKGNSVGIPVHHNFNLYESKYTKKSIPKSKTHEKLRNLRKFPVFICSMGNF